MSFPLKRIDDLNRPLHSYLKEEDEVYFFGEYVVRGRAEDGPTNQLIFNYKKPLERMSSPDWKYKKQAIEQVAKMFRNSIEKTEGLCERVSQATLVPVPPSKAKDSLNYDDRNLRMLELFAPNGDVRELILQIESRDPLHNSKSPRSYEILLQNYKLNDAILRAKAQGDLDF